VTIEALIVQFPECFKPPGQPPRPLKIGIHLDVAAALPDIT
jgi:sRNA-binding protein